MALPHYSMMDEYYGGRHNKWRSSPSSIEWLDTTPTIKDLDVFPLATPLTGLRIAQYDFTALDMSRFWVSKRHLLDFIPLFDFFTAGHCKFIFTIRCRMNPEAFHYHVNFPICSDEAFIANCEHRAEILHDGEWKSLLR
jgi:hypothetical protein